jgi:hypothetical protein
MEQVPEAGDVPAEDPKSCENSNMLNYKEKRLRAYHRSSIVTRLREFSICVALTSLSPFFHSLFLSYFLSYYFSYFLTYFHSFILSFIISSFLYYLFLSLIFPSIPHNNLIVPSCMQAAANINVLGKDSPKSAWPLLLLAATIGSAGAESKAEVHTTLWEADTLPWEADTSPWDTAL